MHRVRKIVIVFLLACAWGWGYLVLNHDSKGAPRWEHAAYAEEAEIAKHLVHGDGFRSPFDSSVDAPASAWSPPIYPHVIAAAFRFFGINTVGCAKFLALVNVVCFGIVCACIASIAGRGAIVAIPLIFIHPAIVYYIGDYWDEYLALAMFFVALSMAYHGCTTIGRASFLGLVLGALMLTNTAYLLAVPVIIYAAVRRNGRAAAVAIIIFVIVLIPWTVRNYSEFHRLMFVRSGASVELWIGNHHGSTGWIPPVNPDHPYKSDSERKRVLSMGEVAYSKLCWQRFVQEFRARKFIAVSVLRAANLLLGDFTKNLAINSIVTILGVIGVIIMGVKRRKDLWILIAGIAAVVPFVFTSASDRYALPIRVILIVIAGMGIVGNRNNSHATKSLT